jgi:biopolymer transport protein ExbD
MDLALPQKESSKAAEQAMVDPDVKPTKDLPELEDTDAPTIVAFAATDDANRGKISSLAIDRLGNTQPIGDLDELKKALKEIRAAADPKDFKGTVKLRGDPKLKWQSILDVMNACQSAGFHRVGFASPLDTSGG